MGNWQAHLLVSENDIPVVKLHQPVRLFVNAFPHMEYKVFEGKVNEISARPYAGVASAESIVYPIKVSVQDPQVLYSDEIYSLAYGMGVEGRIVVERGRVIGLLWRRLLRSVGNAGRHNFQFSNSIMEN